MKKNRFFGIYYKHQSVDGNMIAVISSVANEGPMVQIITNDKAVILKDHSQIDISFKGINFNIHQDDISIVGNISYGPLLKPKKDIMSYYRYLPIEYKHRIYSMYHSLNGKISIDDKLISFENGNGYIEGDQGRNFPKEYLWLNAINKEASITLAIADIPLGLFHILGTTCLIEYNNKEYRFGTYNFTKPILVSKNHITLKKGKYLLDIKIDDSTSHPLKAPLKGNMVRFIHEAPVVGVHYVLRKGNNVICDIRHEHATYEWVFGED